VDGGPGDIVSLELAISRTCQLGNHAGTHDIERTIVLGCAEPDQRVTVAFEKRNPVAYDLGCPGCCGLDDVADPSSASRTSSGSAAR
jgi:hypothetical protein